VSVCAVQGRLNGQDDDAWDARVAEVLKRGAMSKLKILVVIGSTREGRFGDKPAHWIADFLNQDARFEAELVDLRDWPLPFFDQPNAPMRVTNGDYANPVANEWAKKVGSADGFVLIAAEYNHGYTAVLKNALDWLGVEWRRKPVTFVGYGNAGGARAVEQLRLVAVELQMAPIKCAVHLPIPVYLAVRNEPMPVDPKHFAAGEPAATAMRDDLAWWAEALRVARQA
jgi:NAD(P)H-dependent FMN reductase